MLAAYYGHADVVKFLIGHGADPNRLNDKRQSPIAGAVFKKLDAVVEVSVAPFEQHINPPPPSVFPSKPPPCSQG